MSAASARPPLLARPSAQILVAAAVCAAMGAAWLSLREPFGRPGLALLLLPLAGALLPLSSRPFELLLGFVVLSYFRIPEAFPALYPLHLPELVAVAALAALGWQLFGTRRIRPFWPAELTLFALLFAHVGLSVLFASNRETAFGFWSGYYVKVGIVTPAIAWLAGGPRQYGLASRAFVLAGIVVGAVALWNKAHGIDLVEGSRVTIGRELDSVLGDPNDLALVLLFPTSFALGLALTRGIPALGRLFGLGGFVILVPAILATQSRGGLIGLAAVLAVFVRRRIRSKPLLALLMAASVTALFAVAGVDRRVEVAADAGGIDESAQSRLWAWETAFKMALAHPLTGVGIATFKDNYFFYTEHWAGIPYVAHSTWFEVLAETGFPGLLLYASMIGLTAGRLLRARWRSRSSPGSPASWPRARS